MHYIEHNLRRVDERSETTRRQAKSEAFGAAVRTERSEVHSNSKNEDVKSFV